ncbi:MAG: hypothetical protein RQ899_10500 [Pseudomonadales bacterium]|nr:hypothetical protein [Pseudomonadales bacterium]
MKNVFLAHVKLSDQGEWQLHHLEEHLREVGRLASDMAAVFKSEDWAKVAGFWHDLGK